MILIPGKVEISFKTKEVEGDGHKEDIIWISAYIHYYRSDGCILYHIEDANQKFIRKSASIKDLLIRHARVLNTENSKLYDMVGHNDIKSQTLKVFSIENGIEVLDKDDLVIFPQYVHHEDKRVFINQIYDTHDGHHKLIETPISTLNLNVEEDDVYVNTFSLDEIQKHE